MTYLALFFVKLLDNCILTVKSITTYKGKRLVSSILVVISQLLFYLVIQQVVNDNTLLAICIVSISSGMGHYIGFIINDRFKQDDVWTNTVTSSNKEFLVELCTMLREHKIKYLLFNTLNRRFEASYTVTIFSKTKAESKLIDDFLNKGNVAYLRMIDGIEAR